ncbi:MAG: bifunctional hydroxymethylpyrimidine kinase/phosphomethylpyrimidine kinase [Myxococcota bacterium]
MTPIVLSVAGSDSGGGAGIQIDLRAFQNNGVFGTTVLTALTAQNLEGVRDVHPVPVTHVQAQLDAVLDGFRVRAAKTGMLWSADTIEAVADAVDRTQIPWVVDPVMVATSGATLLQNSAISRYRDRLLPRAALVTPNLDEAAVLLERSTIADEDHEEAARELSDRFSVPFLVKGGHRRGALIDVLVADGELHRFESERRSLKTHGSGCALSAAIAARLGRGESLVSAVEEGLDYIRRASRFPIPLSSEIRVLGPL